jgi:hypothetical protein
MAVPELETGWCKHRRRGDASWNWRWFVADAMPDNQLRMTIYKTEAASLSTKAKGVIARGRATISRGNASAAPTGFSAICVDVVPLSASAAFSRHTICVPTITDGKQRLALLTRAMSAGAGAGGIEVCDRSWHLRVYKQTFLLRDAAAWLTDRVGGDCVLSVGTQLLNLGLIAHVCHEHAFELKVGGGLFFRFNTFNIDALCIPPTTALRALATAPPRAASPRAASTLDVPAAAAAAATEPRVALSAGRASETTPAELRAWRSRVAQLERALAAALMRERRVRLLGIVACVSVLAVLVLL